MKLTMSTTLFSHFASVLVGYYSLIPHSCGKVVDHVYTKTNDVINVDADEVYYNVRSVIQCASVCSSYIDTNMCGWCSSYAFDWTSDQVRVCRIYTGLSGASKGQYQAVQEPDWVSSCLSTTKYTFVAATTPFLTTTVNQQTSPETTLFETTAVSHVTTPNSQTHAPSTESSWSRVCPAGVPSCYWFSTLNVTATDAEVLCQAENTNDHLVSINSQHEQNFIFSYISNHTDLQPLDGVYTSGNIQNKNKQNWNGDGSSITYTNWKTGMDLSQYNTGSDKRRCVALIKALAYQWDGIRCDQVLNYGIICEGP